MRINRASRVLVREQSGASLIEFALVLPVFLVLVVGILSYGIAFATQQAVNHAAQRGAEAAISVSPEAEGFAARAREIAQARVATALGYFPGVSGASFALQAASCGDDSVAAVDVRKSQICVEAGGAEASRRVVIVRLAPTFQSLWPGFPVTGFFVMPEFVRATGQAIVAAAPSRDSGA